MNYHEFYDKLFAPLARKLGPIDVNGMFAIIGFDCGGPLNFSTIGAERREKFVTYISCELAVHAEQKPSKFGRYELLCTCDSEEWVRCILTKIGQESMETTFGHHHSLDIGVWVKPRAPIKGILLEKVCHVKIDGEPFGVLRVIGITRPEMEYALAHGKAALKRKLKASGVYPRTEVNRASVV